MQMFKTGQFAREWFAYVGDTEAVLQQPVSKPDCVVDKIEPYLVIWCQPIDLIVVIKLDSSGNMYTIYIKYRLVHLHSFVSSEVDSNDRQFTHIRVEYCHVGSHLYN